jgi:hypothetical protein
VADERGSALVTNPAALAELTRAQDLEQRARQVDSEIMRLLTPVQAQLGALLLERDRLAYEGLAARQRFFQAAKKADRSLEGRGSLHFEKRGEQVYMVWDDTGPRFTEVETAERPDLHPFKPRGPGRRGLDLLYKLVGQ